MIMSAYFFVAARANAPWRSVGDLIADAKRRPDVLTYASNGVGSIMHVGAAAFAGATDTRMTHVPYKEFSQLFTAVATGDVDWAMATIASAGALQKGGKLKYLALAAPNREPQQPDVPTVAEAGGPAGFEAYGWAILSALHGTPPAIAQKVNKDVERVFAMPDVQAKMAEFGYHRTSLSPAGVRDLVEADAAALSKTIKSRTISIE